MIRSLYSGVAGMKSQQTKMDVIGNNIANVGTYGYKSDRATFQDVYYQTTSAATQATGNIGGTNAKQVGYGNSVSSIDTNTKTSAMTATGYSLDVAIAGEGFLQVMGADGNIMYTKAGMLDIDADGNLVDVNGYFVLGVSGESTKTGPSSEKINIALPYLDPNNAKVTEKINNVTYDIAASNMTTKGNVNFSFRASASLPVGQKMAVDVSGSSINVTLNSNEYFADMDEFNAHLNQAITDALGGEQHPAGKFTINSSDESMFQPPLCPVDSKGNPLGLSGAEIIGNNFGYALGDAGYIKSGDDVDKANALKNLFSISSVNSGFQGETREIGENGVIVDSADTPAGFQMDFIKGEDGNNKLRIIVTSQNSVNPVTHLANDDPAAGVYVAEIDFNKLNAPGEVMLRRIKGDTYSSDDIDYSDDETDSFVMNYPEITSIKNVLQQLGMSSEDLAGITALKNNDEDAPEGIGPVDIGNILTLRHTEPSRDLGLGQKSFTLKGGTEGGEQTVANLTAISVGQDGVVVGVHDVWGIMELGRIDLATFANPAGLTKVGSTYFDESLNSGGPIVVNAGTEGTGKIMASTLESSNVDLSSEFTDMIVTQRGFQASSRVITVSDSMLEELINLKR